MKLNIGCGAVRPAGWINTDKSYKIFISELPVSRSFFHTSQGNTVTYQNIEKPWKFNDNSIDVVYSSHLFEHLDSCARDLYLSETVRVLKSGGAFRLVVPDLQKLAKEYLDATDRGEPNAAKQFLYWMNLHRDNLHPNSRPLYKKLYDFIQKYPKQHQTMLDRSSLDGYIDKTIWAESSYQRYGESDILSALDINSVECDEEICASIYFEARKI